MSAPHVPESFRRDLDAWSVAETGRPGNFRPYWLAEDEIWCIQMASAGGRWTTVYLVQDAEAATEDNLRVFRPLDRRVFEDTALDSLMRVFNTGSVKGDQEAYRKWKKEARQLVKDKARLSGLNDLHALTLDAKPYFSRIQSEMDYGHSHGVRSVYPVRG